MADDTVLDALKMMTEENIGAVFVMEGKRVSGIFTERDYTRKVEVKGKDAISTLVKDVMTRNMYTVTSETTVGQCMALMNVHHIRHLPVVDDDHLVGLISIRDVMTAAIENKDMEIKGLENYIMGSGFSG
jgi:CBS domain-containing protein